MANEITIDFPTGNTLYAYLLNAIGQIWNGAAFETPQNANWATYDIALTEAGTTGIYRGNMPSASAGFYWFVVRLQGGGAPAVGDAPVGNGSFEWDGSAVGGLTATDVWGYATRTLTQSAASVIAAVSGSAISVTRLTSWSISLTGLGNISARTALYFTVKQDLDLADSTSILQVDEATGLLVLDGETASDPTDASITVNDAIAGDITIAVNTDATGLTPGIADYDVKMVTATGVTLLTTGEFSILPIATHATT